MNGGGRVIAVDITLDHADPDLLSMPNVTLIEGSSTSEQTLEQIKGLLRPDDRVMVILDSDHATEHVYREMCMYDELVSDAQYMIIEDGLIDQIYPFFSKESPRKAICRYLSEKDDFIQDHFQNRFLLTQNPGGYLLKAASKSAVRFLDKNDCYRPLGVWLPDQEPSAETEWMPLLNQNRKEPNP